ncbi:MAG: OpgC domain-containing protein [Gammaproteobacteria bacterium]|nr:OpgC domain-containing protein [Gammaproteobacteria bacterium]
MKRQIGLDALRGLFLALMTLTHLPTSASRWASQPFGFLSNAEGFVFLSAFLVGSIYASRAQMAPLQTAATLWRRAGKLYVYHLITLVFAFTFAAWIAVAYERPALQHLLGYYLSQPDTAIGEALWLLYRPPLLDILPLYIVFLLASPMLLASRSRGGWGLLLGASAVLWLLAQIGLRGWMHDATTLVAGLRVPPLRQSGAFDLFAWQFLWVGGLFVGAWSARNPAWPKRIPTGLMWTALLAALTLLLLRYSLGMTPAGWRWAVNKWHLAPLRVLEVTAITLIVARCGGTVARSLPLAPLAFLGRSSLPVFTAHVITCLLFLGLIRDDSVALAPATQLAIIIVSFAVLYSVAAWDQAWDRGWRPWSGSRLSLLFRRGSVDHSAA